MSRADATVAVGFVLAAAVEAAVVHRGEPGPLVLGAGGAGVLAVLAVRRVHPVLTLCAIATFGVLGTAIQRVLWPDASDQGGVWLFALMLACHSLGAHGRGRVLALGGLLPLLVVLVADLPTMHGWAMVNGVLFVTTFVGVLPTVVGRLVRLRRDRLDELRAQQVRIMRELRSEQQSRVLAERVRATERLQPALLDGLRELARDADAGRDPAGIEAAARDLLTRTRHEVLDLTAPLDPVPATEPPTVDHVRGLRATAQPWVVLGAGLVAAGLALESTATLPLRTSDLAAVLAGVSVGVPLALLWWRPVAAVAVAWCGAAAFSHLVAPLDGSLSGAGLALSSAFAVALLSRRPAAVVGLAVCLLGQAGVGSNDPVGVAAILGASWLGGLAVNEASRLVEQGHANNLLLAEQQTAATRRALVEERLRLAREVHDQIGHSLTVVALQAGAARRLGPEDPDRRRELLRTIASAARHGAAGLDAAASASTELDELLDRTRAAGLDVDADIGDVALLDDARRIVVLRVVQEALTNVLRHAPGAHASVLVRRDGREEVVVEVTNTAPARAGAGSGSGRGLPGIRERIAGLGGVVGWHPRPDGGFEVRAVLPAGTLESVTS